MSHVSKIAKDMKCSEEDIMVLSNRANITKIFTGRRANVMSISTLRTAVLDAASACAGNQAKFAMLMETLNQGAAHAQAKHATLLDKAVAQAESAKLAAEKNAADNSAVEATSTQGTLGEGAITQPEGEEKSTSEVQ